MELAHTSSDPAPQRQQPGLGDGKPITYGLNGGGGAEGGERDEDGGTELDLPGFDDSDRPRTSRGRTADTAVVVEESTSGGRGEEEGAEVRASSPDVLRLDSPMEPPSHRKGEERTRGDSASRVDFGDDDDDILSGMGLDDEDAQPPTSSMGGDNPSGRRPSLLDDLLGLGSRKKEKKANEQEVPKVVGGAPGGRKEEEEEGYQFGGYMPSAAGGSTGGRGVKLRGPPAGRRWSLQLDSLSSSPSPAPSQPTKKSVRFADTVEVSDRPFTSPAVSERRTSRPEDRTRGGGRGGGGRRRRMSADAVMEDSARGRKPPLPQQDQQKQQQYEHQQQKDQYQQQEGKQQQQQHQEIESKGAELPLLREEGPAQPAIRGRRRSSPVQRSSVAGLFEEPERLEGGGGGVGGGKEGGGSGEALGQEGEKESAGEQESLGETKPDKFSPPPVEKLEHPVFPWQQATPNSAGGTSVPVGQKATEPRASEGTREGEGERGEQSVTELASLQKQLLEQQKLMDERILQLQASQAQDRSEGGGRRKRASAEEGEDGVTRRALQERVRELEGLLEKETKERATQQVIYDVMADEPSWDVVLPPSLLAPGEAS